MKGVIKMSLTKRETEFCRYYTACRHTREAAARAGFAFPERSGMRLMARDAIRQEIERLSQQERGTASAIDGLKRIAFGSVTDAVRLVLSPEPSELESLDLFMVSEIKRTDKGGMEIKFFDRIKALQTLLEAGEEGGDSDTSQFVDAIYKGASAINGAAWSENDDF